MHRRTITRLGIASLLLTAPGILGLRQVRDSRKVQRLWRSLLISGGHEVFTTDMVAELPEPVQRYFLHALKPGTPLAASVELTMRGTIKLGQAWHPFRARQILTPGCGFVWRASAALNGSPIFVRGADYYAQGEGRVRFALLGLLPVVQATGPDVSRSAMGRFLGEAALWLPACLVSHPAGAWQVLDHEQLQVTLAPLTDGGVAQAEALPFTFTIDAQGGVREAMFPRWHDTLQNSIPFGIGVEAERTFGGYTIPVRIHAGWWYGSERYQSEGMFFRTTLTSALFR